MCVLTTRSAAETTRQLPAGMQPAAAASGPGVPAGAPAEGRRAVTRLRRPVRVCSAAIREALSPLPVACTRDDDGTSTLGRSSAA
jgi:hypothetical protein